MTQFKIASQFTKVDDSPEFLRMYWDGPENVFNRYFTYLREGVSLLNEGKYLMGMLGLGILNSDIVFSWWMLLVGVLVGVPIVCFIGRWNIFRGNKSRQYISNQHGGVVQWQGHNMVVAQVELLELIARSLNPKEYEELLKKNNTV